MFIYFAIKTEKSTIFLDFKIGQI